MALVTCNTIGSGLTAWAGNATQAELDALCAALNCAGGGGPSSITVNDTQSVNLAGDGSAAIPLTADVAIDPAATNALTSLVTGLFVENGTLSWNAGTNTLTFIDNLGAATDIVLAGVGTDVHVTSGHYDSITKDLTLTLSDASTVVINITPRISISDTSDVNLTGDGSSATPLMAGVNLDTAPDNVLISGALGLLVHNSDLTWNGGTDTLSFTDNLGAVTNIVLTGIGTDVHLASASFNDTTNLLTLTLSDASTVTVTIPSDLPAFTSPADDGKVLFIDPGTGKPGWLDPSCSVTTTVSSTLTDADNGALWIGSGTINVPDTLSVGFHMDIKGAATINLTGTNTLVSDGSLTSVKADAGATLIKIGATTYWLAGALV